MPLNNLDNNENPIENQTLSELWVSLVDIKNSSRKVEDALSKLSFLDWNKKVDFKSDMEQILSNPNQKDLFFEAINRDKVKIQETLKPYVQDALKSISVKGIDYVDNWDIFALQTYLILFKWKSKEDVWFWTVDKKIKLQEEFNSLLNDNFLKYIKSLLLSNQLSPLQADSMNKKLDEYTKYWVDINSDWRVDYTDLMTFQNYMLEAMRFSNVETDKIHSTISRIMEYNFDINQNISFVYNDWKRENHYSSLDNHNPKTTQEDKTKDLENVLLTYKEEYTTVLSELNPDKENTKDNLKKIIEEFYLEHKEELNKHWIDDITKLTPKQATILSSMITMYSMNYYYAQGLNPADESWYLEKTTPEEKESYFKSKNNSIEFIHIVNNFKQKEWYPDLTIYNIKKTLPPEKYKILSLELNEIYKDWYKYTFSEQDKENILKNQIEEVDFVYKNTSELYENSQKIDTIPVDELLKWWKWICRNYAVANEKVFESLKDMQSHENNQLKNSSLIRFVDYKTINNIYPWEKDLKQLWIDEADDWWFSWHARNLLITIDKDWKAHKTQIDPTWSDLWDWDRAEWQWSWLYGDVKTLDRTYERVFQDISKDNKKIDYSKNKKQIDEIMEQMMRFVNSIDDISIKEVLINKVSKYLYDNINNSDLTKMDKNIELLQSLIWKNYDQNKSIREWLILNAITNNNINFIEKIIGNYDPSNLEALTIDLTFSIISWNQEKIDKLLTNNFLKEEVLKLSPDEFEKKYENFWIWKYLVNNYWLKNRFL